MPRGRRKNRFRMPGRFGNLRFFGFQRFFGKYPKTSGLPKSSFPTCPKSSFPTCPGALSASSGFLMQKSARNRQPGFFVDFHYEVSWEGRAKIAEKPQKLKLWASVNDFSGISGPWEWFHWIQHQILHLDKKTWVTVLKTWELMGFFPKFSGPK